MNDDKSKAIANANNLASLGLKLIFAPLALVLAAVTLFVCVVLVRAILG